MNKNKNNSPRTIQFCTEAVSAESTSMYMQSERAVSKEHYLRNKFGPTSTENLLMEKYKWTQAPQGHLEHKASQQQGAGRKETNSQYLKQPGLQTLLWISIKQKHIIIKRIRNESHRQVYLLENNAMKRQIH